VVDDTTQGCFVVKLVGAVVDTVAEKTVRTTFDTQHWPSYSGEDWEGDWGAAWLGSPSSSLPGTVG
jgi:hypothetical protein